MKKEFINDELPPFLRKMKGEDDGLRIPEGYFDDMEDAVFARLKSAGDVGRPSLKKVQRPGLFAKFVNPRIMTAVAAALALILAAVWFFREPTAAVQAPQFASAELTEEDIESYVMENVHEFEPEQLASLPSEEYMEPAAEEPSLEKSTPKRHSSDELNSDDLKNVLDDMSEEELEQIL